jgi:hypothetical protein
MGWVASPRVAHYLGGEPLGPFDAEPLLIGESCGHCLHPYWAHPRRLSPPPAQADEAAVTAAQARREPPAAAPARPHCIGRGCRCRREWIAHRKQH